MKHGPNDDLQFLKDAWNSLEAPKLARELNEEDEPTRAAVQWLQAAYRSAAPEPRALVLLDPPPARARAIALVIAASVFAGFLHLLTLIPSHPISEVAMAPTPAPAPTPLFDPVKNQLELQSGPVRLIFIGDRD